MRAKRFLLLAAALLSASTVLACADPPPPRAAPGAPAARPADPAARPADPAARPADPAARPAPSAALGSLAGAYRVTGMSFEELTLEPDGTFRSHLHARPFTTGTWQQQGPVVVLRESDGSTTRVTDLARQGDAIHGRLGGQAVRWVPIR